MNNAQPSEDADQVDKARPILVRVWIWVGIVVLGAVVVNLAGVLSNAIGVIVWTAVFVFMLRGPVNWLDSHGVSRTIGTFLAYVLFIAVLSAIVFVIFSPFFGINAQFEDLAKSLPTYVEAFQSWAMGIYERYSDILQNDRINEWVTSMTASVGEWVQTFATTTASSVVAAGTSIANTVMCIGFALVIAFWMLVDLPNLGREVNRLISDELRPDAQMIHLTVTRVAGGYLKATLIQCAIIGFACGVLFWLLGVPSPAALAVITGLLNIIPIVGPWLGGALAFVASVITSPIVGVISLIGTIVIQQIVYTFVSPKLMGESVDIHPALTFIALLAGSGIGTALGGLTGALVGALLSIPLVAILKSVFVYYFEKRTGRRIVAEDGVFFKGVAGEHGDFDPVADATAPLPTPAPSASGRIIALPDISGMLGKLPIDDGEDNEDDGDGGPAGSEGVSKSGKPPAHGR